MEENKKFKQVLFGFKVCYMVYLLLAFNAFVNGASWMNIASYVITILGAGMILWMLFRYKRYKKGYNLWILAGFAASYIISAAAHFSYGGAENVKGLIWLVFPLVLLYLSAFDMSGEEIRQEMKWLSAIYIIYCTVVNIISLSMVWWGRKYDYVDETGFVHAIGYRWQRLWGIYDDPNHGATITVIALFMLLYLFSCTRKWWQRIGLLLLFIIHYLYLALSDSRTGIIMLAAGLFLWHCLLAWVEKKRSVRPKHVLLLCIVGVLAAGTAFVGDVGVKAIYQPMDAKIEAVMKAKNPATVKSPAGKTKTQKPDTRKKDLQHDYSNGRLEIWKNGLQIVEKSPVIGVGFRNIAGYAAEHFPEGYLVKNRGGVKYDSMHNLELDILVGQGAIGGILFLLLLINSSVILFKRMYQVSGEYKTEPVFSTAACAALLAAGTFLSFIFYVNAPQNMCFWLLLGYAMRLCQIGAENK
ncbi:O-antigen ligase family protein [Clostridium sp. C105KSO13]|uniref:O-antigen ligase family protein n=1 Tax=Clostridium sp. C105KSO13 TaxID=1776045 RepID=UPI00074061A0|nr:O-antigen ligase family protein [Clostridium sp. C105KSO13]CUX34309.1 O-Antigen ligase [Clostridium sp. C105KSO13]